jgi:hypothetical protein
MGAMGAMGAEGKPVIFRLFSPLVVWCQKDRAAAGEIPSFLVPIWCQLLHARGAFCCSFLLVFANVRAGVKRLIYRDVSPLKEWLARMDSNHE